MSNKKIAIVGLSCRFPDANNLENYWDLLKNSKSAVTAINASRFGADFYQHPNKKERGKSYSFAAGTLDKIDEFDAQFFKISNREAAQMDPQQRLLLELAVEAFEHAGLKTEHLAGSKTGVYIGISGTDYRDRTLDDLAALDAYSMTGNTHSIAANRLSYVFDFCGPSFAVDTACSSSLVAFHQACQSLHSGESSMALVGGINMLLHPLPFVGFANASMLSKKGQCHAFSEQADGYVRSEGAAILVLKPLEQAQADGDFIHAVVLASAVNCDGKTSSLTVPSITKQQALLEEVYKNAGISANQVDYLEAHGTGTLIGDPIESAAISQALAQKRQKPLLIGSVKSNIGHMETASGLAGLIKIILAIKHQAIPASLHAEKLNPEIPFAENNLQVNHQYQALNSDKPLIMGVNSFGFGGANAHVVIEEYKNTVQKPTSTSVQPPLILSAKSSQALQDLAQQYQYLISAKKTNYYDLAWSAYHHRSLYEQRLIVQGSKENINQALITFAQNGAAKNTTTLITDIKNPKTVFVFSGNGCQWQGMGQVLFDQDAVFKKAFLEVEDYWFKHAKTSLLEELERDEKDSNLALTEVAQPLLFAIQVGLVRVLKHAGINADAVVGHSVGEVAAAWAAGCLSLADAVWVLYERSQAQALTKGCGRMSAVGLSAADALQKITTLNLDKTLFIAGINSPTSVTLSGSLASLEVFEADLDEQVFYRLLDLDYAFHSPEMDQIEQRVLQNLNGLTAKKGPCDFISTVQGAPFTSLDNQYWWDNIRQPVQFAKALDYLIENDFNIYIEIGAKPILSTYLRQAFAKNAVQPIIIKTLHSDEKHQNSLIETINQAMLCGAFKAAQYFPVTGRFIQLPLYPWQKKSHWYEKTTESYDLVNLHREHPLLGYRLKDAVMTWQNQLDTQVIDYLADHVVDGAVVFPAAGYVEMAIAAAKIYTDSAFYELENIEIHRGILFDEHHLKELQFILSPEDGRFKIQSRSRLSDESWVLNTTGRILQKDWLTEHKISFDLKSFILKSDYQLTGEEHYQLTNSLNLSYGPAFQGVKKAWYQSRIHKTVIAELVIPEKIKSHFDDYQLHPCLLDSSFQILVDFFKEEIEQGFCEAMIPIQLGKIVLYQEHANIKYVKAQLIKHSPRSFVVDFILMNSKCEIVVELKACRFRSISFIQKPRLIPAYHFSTELQPRVDMLAASPLAKQTLTNKKVADSITEKIKNNPYLQRESFFNSTSLLIDVLVSSYILETFQKFGLKQFNLKSLFRKGVLNKNKALVLRLLAILEEDGLVIKKQGEWTFQERHYAPNAQDIWHEMVSETADILPEMLLLGRCGEHLYDVLIGKKTAISLIAPEKSSIQEQWLDNSMTFRAIHDALLNAVQIFIKDWPADKRLRIAVFGGKNAAWVQQLIELLGTQDFDCLLLEQEEHICNFINNSQQNEFVKAFTVDINIDDLTKIDDFSKGYFDLIVVNHRLYEADNLSELLKYLDQQLVSNGKLLITELQPDRFSDLTLGLAENWCQDNDENEMVYSRLFNSAQWENLLTKNHYQEVVCFFEPDDSTKSGAALYLASASIKKNICFKYQAETWLIFADSQSNDLALELLQKSLLKKIQCILLYVEKDCSKLTFKDQCYYLDAEKPAQFEDFWQQMKAQSIDFKRVVNLVGFNKHPPIQENLSHSCLDVIYLTQSIRKACLTTQLNLITFASGFIDFPKSIQIQPHQAMLAGLARVMMNEYPELSCRLIDWQDSFNLKNISRELIKEINTETTENEVILTSSSRYVTRLNQAELQQSDELMDVCLDFSAPGKFEHLYWKALKKKALQADEIAISPVAVGLNFRDIMYTSGLLADEAVENGFSGASLGLEFSGRVVKVGDSVKGFNIGDPVLGFAPACFSSRITTKTTAVALIPENWSFEEAATIPTTFFTAYYALVYLAQLEEGEKILIHGASGGVGLAAIQIAKYLKLEIFATAGTDEKRDFVRMFGADHVMDSRSLKFADDVMEKTNGEGVDAVLNVISGEVINRNLSILKPFGRFLEIGKTDFYKNSRIGLRPFRNNISYFGIDADQLLTERADFARRLFKKMMGLFKQKKLRPLPYRSFLANQVKDAFKYMNQTRHIGKIVVSFQAGYPKPENIHADINSFKCRQKSTYLITGGTQGFGLKTAQWLVRKGVESLVLISRRAILDEKSAGMIKYLQQSGIQIDVKACDVTDLNALKALITDIQKSAYPLAGIVHAAMVLDDGIIDNLNKQQFERVIAPKVIGAWNLHQVTENIKLDCFLMYSSATTFLGNPGQANYIAANMYLEALMRYRQQQGLVAHFASWGGIDDVGYLTHNQDIKESLQKRLGGQTLNSDKALKRLEMLLASDYNGVALIDLDWQTLAKVLPAAFAPKYKKQMTKAVLNDRFDEIRKDLRGKEPRQQIEYINGLLIDEISLILRQPKETIVVTKPLNDIGMDSLMGMELVSAIESMFKIKIPVMLLTDGSSIEKISQHILDQLSLKLTKLDEVKQTIEDLSYQQGVEISSKEAVKLAKVLKKDV